MRKFFAIVKREYKKIVRAWSFVISTLLAPMLALGFAVVPALMFSIKGEPTRLVIVDQNGQIAERFKGNLSDEKYREKLLAEAREKLKDVSISQEEKIKNDAKLMGGGFIVSELKLEGRTLEQARSELNEQIKNKQLDAYLIVPKDFDAENFELYARNTSDFILLSRLENSANDVVREARLAQVNINKLQFDEISKKISFAATKISERGEEKDDGNSFWFVFIIGMLLYITLAIYGQMILGAVVEEKETKIAEVLFSSAKPFQLLMGKLVGVGLAGLTQLGIWVASVLVAGVYIVASGFVVKMPNISPFAVALFFVFFILGFFTYATIYALIGSMVTTVQEGGQFALFPTLFLLIGLYGAFPVIRDANSGFAFWMSVMPFVSPIVMPVRMIVQMPAAWEILLSIALNIATILLLVWIAARVYRIGMLMYGKKATIPEVWRWIRQA